MRLMKVKQVAELLDVSERSIHNKIKNGALPVIRIAGITRIDGDKLAELLERVPTLQPTIWLGDDNAASESQRAS